MSAMKPASLARILRDEEIAQFKDLLFTKLDATYQELGLLQRTIREVPPTELEWMRVTALFGFVAEVAINNGQSKKEFLASMEAAYDEFAEEDQDVEPESAEE